MRAAASPSFMQVQFRRISSLMAHVGTASPAHPRAAPGCMHSACLRSLHYLLLLQMTQAATDLVGMSEEVAVWPLPIDFLCFWLGDGDALHPASASTTRRRLFFFGKESAGKIPTYFFSILLYIWERIQRIK